MNLFQAIFLGVVQGITEFLPVSSSGHLTILQILFGMDTGNSLLFDVMLHLGTVGAICVAFHKDISRLFAEAIHMTQDILSNIRAFYLNNKSKDAIRYKKIVYNNYRRFVGMIVISTIPTAIIGYASRELIVLASQSLLIPGICLMITSVMLLITDVAQSGKRIPTDISFSSAFLVGIAQGISVLPGLSRSGTTIAACLLSGFDKRFAVRYSFIMSIPAILGATILELKEYPGSQVSFSQFLIYLVGAAAAGGVGYFSIRKMVQIVKRKSFKGFSAYCLVIGIISLAGYIALR